MKLTVKERIVFASLFPKNYNLVEGTLIKDIKKKVEMTQEELKDYEVKSLGNQITWNADKTKEKDIVFTDMEIDFLKERIKELDKEKKLSDDNIDLAQKINKI